MTRTRITAALAALSTALLLSACDNTPADEAANGHADHGGAGQTAVVTAEPAGFNPADVTFATDMIPHHEQAVELSALASERSTNPDLLALAKRISAAQEPEITTMKAFLVQWKENPQDNAGRGEHGDHGDMAGMVDQATMAKLQSSSGTEFDRLWLTSMIAHHRGAIEMAEEELADGKNVDAKALAQNIIATQQAENDEMDKMLAAIP